MASSKHFKIEDAVKHVLRNRFYKATDQLCIRKTTRYSFERIAKHPAIPFSIDHFFLTNFLLLWLCVLWRDSGQANTTHQTESPPRLPWRLMSCLLILPKADDGVMMLRGILPTILLALPPVKTATPQNTEQVTTTRRPCSSGPVPV